MPEYTNKVILAPMVRVGTLPMRLLALEYGADLVFSLEIVDKRLLGSQRIVNEVLGTVDYVKEGSLTFRTCAKEKSRLIFQLGTADPQLALQAALMVADDVAGIDVNCGCPKRFSLQAGMGAALLRQPEKLVSILTNLVKHCGRPVSAKIRILPEEEETLQLVKAICGTGISALTVHCRTPMERPYNAAHWDRLASIFAVVNVPLIVNGDVLCYEDIARIRTISGASSVMIARAAQWNASVFRPAGPLDVMSVSRDYLRVCMTTGNNPLNSKYVLLQMWIEQGTRVSSQKALVVSLQRAKTMQDLCAIFNVEYSPSFQTDHQSQLVHYDDDHEDK